MSQHKCQQFVNYLRPTITYGAHPNIVQLLGVCDQDGTSILPIKTHNNTVAESMLITMEHDGEQCLRDTLRSARYTKRMSSDHLMQVMIGCVNGVAHLTKHKVSHIAVTL
jgi:hypothetical protein